MHKVRVGLVGTQFISTIHAEALKAVPQAELDAVASPTLPHAEEFAQKYGIPLPFTTDATKPFDLWKST